MEGVEVKLHSFLTSALYEGEWLPSLPGRFTIGENVHGTRHLF
jgi:hypothetical protein